jgi:glycosyltransferase involved in cell wall biosynthesis
VSGPGDVPIDFSVVIPVFFNEGELAGTMASLRDEVIAKNPDLRCEVIFVDDGSGDGSLAELLRLRSEDAETIRVVKLSRNFGQVNALFAGFSLARGRCVVAMSADGQDPAHLINDMLQAHFHEGFEIVACAREGRDESRYRILTSRLFYALMARLSFPSMPPGGFDFFLLSRRVVEVLLRNREAHGFLQGQILWTGFRTKFLPYRRRMRETGESRWTFGRKLTYLIDGVLGYSFLPIRLISLMGIVVALLGFAYAVQIFFMRLTYGHPVQGWAPLMIVLLVMGGIQMLMLGVIGEYVWRSLAQIRNRDSYVIEAIYDDVEARPEEARTIETRDRDGLRRSSS